MYPIDCKSAIDHMCKERTSLKSLPKSLVRAVLHMWPVTQNDLWFDVAIGNQMDPWLFGDALSKFLHSFFSIAWALKGDPNE